MEGRRGWLGKRQAEEEQLRGSISGPLKEIQQSGTLEKEAGDCVTSHNIADIKPEAFKHVESTRRETKALFYGLSSTADAEPFHTSAID